MEEDDRVGGGGGERERERKVRQDGRVRGAGREERGSESRGWGCG